MLGLAACGRVGFDALAGGDPPSGDAVTPDAASADAASPDANVDPCDPSPGPDTVALYTFDAADLGADATGRHPGASRGGVTAVAGGAACGTGALAGMDNAWVVVAPSPDFELAVGSLELYVRTPTPALGVEQGILSRDAGGRDADGHVYVGLADNGQLFVRLQTRDGEAHRCTEPLPADRWVHVGVNFGGTFALWVDHVLATAPTVMLNGSLHDCMVPHASGTVGNANALVLGAGAIFSGNDDPDPTPTGRYFPGGLLDQVHLRSAPHDFGTP